MIRCTISMRLVLVVAILFICRLATAQIIGTITDPDGLPLPYANIYLSGSNVGTSSNLDGSYTLALEVANDYTIVYQYVGYQSVKKDIVYTGEPILLDMQLRPQSVDLGEITIAADAEDPAYPIMRQVIASRDYYKGLVPAFTADVYIKGLVKMTDAPEKIMGQEVGNLGGMIDSSRQGILYLTETQSSINYQYPDQITEKIYASKSSGVNSGLDFNNLRFAWFNFYKERLELNRDLVSPLADDAFTYYRYRLEGTYYDEDGLEINKIAVVPKDRFRPVFFGYLYVVENAWNLKSLELSVTGKAAKIAAIDTVTIKQSHVPIPGDTMAARYLINQSLEFTSNMLGFAVGGGFTYIFTDYQVASPSTARRTREVLAVLPDAEKDSVYWSTARPIPLTSEEITGYRKRDSLKVLLTSQPYLDSIDRINNVLKWSKILLGYSYQNSFKNYSISNSGLAQKISFNAVEGIKVGNQTEYEYNNKDSGKILRATGNVYYGLSDQRFKIYGNLFHRYDRKNSGWINLEGGRRYMQVDHQNPIPPISNTLRSLFEKEHLSKVYSNTFARLSSSREVLNGLFVRAGAGIADRRSLQNSTDFSLYNRDGTYEANDIGIDNNRSTAIDVSLFWYPGMRYMTYTSSKVWLTSNWPTVSLHYKEALAVFDKERDASFSRLEINIRDSDLGLGLWGTLRYNITAGTFLSNTNVNRMDRRHFLTNNLAINYDERYYTQFKNMPYYTYDTDESYATGIAEYSLNGLLMDKVPLLRSSGAYTVLGAGHLTTTERSYTEVSIGIDGFNVLGLSIFRLDYIWSWDGHNYSDRSLVVTIRNPLF